jgi:hypothetical protein
VYFDPFISQRINGIDALRKWYEGVRGKMHIDHYEVVEPKLELSGEMALLTFTSPPTEAKVRCAGTQQRFIVAATEVAHYSFPLVTYGAEARNEVAILCSRSKTSIPNKKPDP